MYIVHHQPTKPNSHTPTINHHPNETHLSHTRLLSITLSTKKHQNHSERPYATPAPFLSHTHYQSPPQPKKKHSGRAGPDPAGDGRQVPRHRPGDLEGRAWQGKCYSICVAVCVCVCVSLRMRGWACFPVIWPGNLEGRARQGKNYSICVALCVCMYISLHPTHPSHTPT